MFFFQTPWLPEFVFKVKDFSLLKRMSMANDEEFPVYKYVFSQPGTVSLLFFLSIKCIQYVVTMLPLWHKSDLGQTASNVPL